MKKMHLAFALLFSLAASAQVDYSGNGRTGFGGTVGNSTLTMDEVGDNITFLFTKGGGDLNDKVVIYVDSKSGGFSTTSSFTDAGDDLRKAISGYNGTNRATLNFPTGFEPDYAVAFGPNYAGSWELVANGPHTNVVNANLTPTGTTTSPTYSFTVNKGSIGLSTSGDISFKFLVTYISTTAFRSNEFIGDPGPAANPGSNTSYTATSSLLFSTALPVCFTNVGIIQQNNCNALNWQVAGEDNISHYEIWSSADGVHFEKTAVVNTENQFNYDYIDVRPYGGAFYKIAAVTLGGQRIFTKIMHLNIAEIENLQIIPLSRNIHIRGSALTGDKVRVALFNTSGQLVLKKEFEHSSGEIQLSLPLNIQRGTYIVTVQQNEQRKNKQIMIK